MGGVKFFHILLQKLSLIVCLSYCITLNRKRKLDEKNYLKFIFCCLTMGAFAQQPLGGFLYGTEAEPKGTEWEAPENCH